MFPLLRYFSLASLGALAIALLAVIWLARDVAVRNLFRLGEENNIALTRAFTNTIWPKHSAFLAAAEEQDGPAIRGHPGTARLDADIRALAQGLAVRKVKIFSLGGNTLYSSDPAQIGERRPDHPAIVKARAGGVTSELIERGKFSALDGEYGRVSLVSSYIPMLAADRSIVGVMEVYNDMTALVAHTERQAWELALGLLPAFAILYGALYLIVRRGDRLLRRQYAELRASREQARAQADRLEAEMAERQRAEREVLALREVEVNQRATRVLITNLSHELRTPLNAIIGFAQVIAAKSFGPEAIERYADYAGDIERSGQHLLSIINSMLDLAKAEAGKLKLHESPFDLAGVASQCIQMLSQQAAAGAVKVSLRAPSDLPHLSADERIVRQIILNLLSNAIKFTPSDGRVDIEIGLDAFGALALCVADTGKGIAPDLIPRVMSPFGQADDDLNRRHEGTGLGLPIVKAMVELHGGVFHLQSDVGKGTRASVAFPPGRTLRQAA